VVPAPANAAGSAAAPMPSAAPAAAPTPPPAIDVVPAKIVKRIIPVPPGGLARGKDKGYVVVKFSIGVNGRVGDLEVLESEPQGVFDNAAQDAVRKWVYEPRKENGVAVESSAKARLVFDPTN
jgi:protein TonB